MFDYKIYQDGKKLPDGDEEIIVTFLKMLDFSAEYLSPIYETETIRFCPETKEILIKNNKKHEEELENEAKKCGFVLKMQ